MGFLTERERLSKGFWFHLPNPQGSFGIDLVAQQTLGSMVQHLERRRVSFFCIGHEDGFRSLNASSVQCSWASTVRRTAFSGGRRRRIDCKGGRTGSSSLRRMSTWTPSSTRSSSNEGRVPHRFRGWPVVAAPTCTNLTQCQQTNQQDMQAGRPFGKLSMLSGSKERQ